MVQTIRQEIFESKRPPCWTYNTGVPLKSDWPGCKDRWTLIKKYVYVLISKFLRQITFSTNEEDRHTGPTNWPIWVYFQKRFIKIYNILPPGTSKHLVAFPYTISYSCVSVSMRGQRCRTWTFRERRSAVWSVWTIQNYSSLLLWLQNRSPGRTFHPASLCFVFQITLVRK